MQSFRSHYDPFWRFYLDLFLLPVFVPSRIFHRPMRFRPIFSLPRSGSIHFPSSFSILRFLSLLLCQSPARARYIQTYAILRFLFMIGLPPSDSTSSDNSVSEIEMPATWQGRDCPRVPNECTSTLMRYQQRQIHQIYYRLSSLGSLSMLCGRIEIGFKLRTGSGLRGRSNCMKAFEVEVESEGNLNLLCQLCE